MCACVRGWLEQCWPHCPTRSSQGPQETGVVFLHFVGMETKVQRHQIIIKVLLRVGDDTRVWTWAFCPPASAAPQNTVCPMPPLTYHLPQSVNLQQSPVSWAQSLGRSEIPCTALNNWEGKHFSRSFLGEVSSTSLSITREPIHQADAGSTPRDSDSVQLGQGQPWRACKHSVGALALAARGHAAERSVSQSVLIMCHS